MRQIVKLHVAEITEISYHDDPKAINHCRLIVWLEDHPELTYKSYVIKCKMLEVTPFSEQEFEKEHTLITKQ